MPAPADVHVPHMRWRVFYALVGAAALLFALFSVLGPVQGALQDCSLRIQPLDIRVRGSGSCSYHLDLTPALISGVAGLVLLLGAWRYRSADAVSTVLTGLAVPIAIALAAFPLYTVWWLIDFYRLSVGPMELLMVAVAVGILALALLAGWRTARYLAARPRSTGT